LTSVLGLPLDLAKAILEQAGETVECHEVQCRKGSPGADERVIAVRSETGKTVLLYAGFHTSIEN